MDWREVAGLLEAMAAAPPCAGGQLLLDEGQCASIAELARRIRAGRRMALLADEVGMGKTRIAVALVDAVRRAGGRSAIVLPPGVGAQWQAELRRFNPDDRTLLPLRSYESFIGGFFVEEDMKTHDKHFVRERRQAILRDRRLQRELPQGAWADERILMISHNFAAMRFSNTGGWRRNLLGQVKHYLDRNVAFTRRRKDHEYDRASRRAAHKIAAVMRESALELKISGNPRTTAAAEYRSQVLPLIGYGLGRFDLVVVDEAHKARGTDSSLSRILGPVTWESEDPFRFGMTATPVELDAQQWLDTIARIGGREDGVDVGILETIRDDLRTYVEVVARLQVEELDGALVAEFERAAEAFQSALAPYVLRRDKRDDPTYAPYIDSYRQVQVQHIEPRTDTTGFSHDWLRRFAALEALSQIPDSDTRLKRLRLALPQGLGLGSLERGDPDVVDTSGKLAPGAANGSDIGFWIDALASKTNDEDIYAHPAITEAVALIESYTREGEKVLVFGRFIQPIYALTRLLDAREMLRQLSRNDGHWPARSISNDLRPALQIAMRDQGLWKGEPCLDYVERMLSERAETHERQRQRALDSLYDEVVNRAEAGEWAAKLLKDRWRGDDPEDGAPQKLGIASLLEALEARRPRRHARSWTCDELLAFFGELVTELLEAEEDADTETEADARHAKNLSKLDERLRQHLSAFSGREGSFARVMSGRTQAQTRRNLQASFNREGAWPMVIVSQSQVGREGLNLHEACCVVVLLHSEWNPAIVEQQIGRVDRKNSLWEKRMREWKATGEEGEMPTIRVHPIVLRGTYDDHNWQVLETRWRALRGQLHGEVLPDNGRSLASTEELSNLMERVLRSTPEFSPLRLSV
ncbi:helicase [Leisingera aquaemixtae]|uniref:Helicase n=1 Tax=Leisingera aquaemixtae TaxID=1396826 RepID=A0ABY5WPJ1_9RHOB|nr:helicase [Leisingera aquaemixtae]